MLSNKNRLGTNSAGFTYRLDRLKLRALKFRGPTAGADPGFQDRGVYSKKLRRAEGGTKIFEVFRVKNHDFTPKNLIFFQF
jgi:hypothetical protein